MRTYPVLAAGNASIQAFEIEHPYITPRAIARLLAQTEGVAHVRRRALARDIKVEFTFRERPFVVWEPHGADGRYWIGPDGEVELDDVAVLRAAFERYRPPLLRALYGSFMTSWVFTHPFKKHHGRHSRPVRVG